MVNETLLNWFKEGLEKGYSVKELKKKALEKGYVEIWKVFKHKNIVIL